MKIVGITGGIGAGKSVVSRMLRCRGFKVYDCDLEARRLMNDSELLKSEIASKMGECCLDADGNLNRIEIAKRVFADDSLRLWLNAKVHAMVRDDIRKRMSDSVADLFFVESAILNSSQLTQMCSSVWLVDAPINVRLKRAAERDGANVKDILARMEAQKNELNDFGSVSCYVINNDGSVPLLPQIDEILNKTI